MHPKKLASVLGLSVQFREKLNDLIYLSSLPRTVHASFHRVLQSSEKRLLQRYLARVGDRRLIAVNVAQAHFFEHLRDLWYVLRSHPKLAPILVGPTRYPPRSCKRELFDALKQDHAVEYGREIFPYPWLREARPDLLVEASASRYGDGTGIGKVMYSHGMACSGFSKHMRDVRHLERYRAVLLGGPLQRRALLRAAEALRVRLPDLYEVGYLRVDRLLRARESFDKQAFLTSLGLPHTPLVLYAPTWGPFSSLEEWLDLVVQATGTLGLGLILRLHPSTLMGASASRWKAKLAALTAESRHVRAVLGREIDEALLGADVMVSDVSGVALEFLALEKPVVFLPSPAYFAYYGEDRPERWVRTRREPRNCGELVRALDEALSSNRDGLAMTDLVYQPGGALGAILDSLTDLVRRRNGFPAASDSFGPPPRVSAR